MSDKKTITGETREPANTSDAGRKAPAKVRALRANYPALRIEFAAWCISPDSKGTQQQWAKDHGVDQTTLSSWKQHPDYLAAIAEWRADYKARFGEVASALHRKAKTGHVPAARTLAEILGELAPQKLITKNVTSLEDLFRQEQAGLDTPQGWKPDGHAPVSPARLS